MSKLNKHLIGSIIGTCTTVLGLLFVGLSTLWAPLPTVFEARAVEPAEINPCSLNSSSTTFLNRDIVVQATLYKIDEDILVYPNIFSGLSPYSDCGVSDPRRGYDSLTWEPGIWTELDTSSYDGPNSDLPTLFQTSRTGFEIDVEIHGVLLPTAYKRYGSRYRITATKIKLTGNWRSFTPKGAA